MATKRPTGRPISVKPHTRRIKTKASGGIMNRVINVKRHPSHARPKKT